LNFCIAKVLGNHCFDYNDGAGTSRYHDFHHFGFSASEHLALDRRLFLLDVDHGTPIINT